MRIKHAKPNVGDTRTVTKFLWFPMTIGGDETRWFETTTWTERYTEVAVVRDIVPEPESMWVPIYWGSSKCPHGYEDWDNCPDCCH